MALNTPLVQAAYEWVNKNYEFNAFHLINALEWLDRIAPDASEAMRIAALTHDMERAFDGPDKPIHTNMGDGDEAYYEAHARRSARIVAEWLREQNAHNDLITEVEKLIRAHEVGGWEAANLVQAADSISLLDVNIDVFLTKIENGEHTVDEVRKKFDFSYNRIQVDHAREMAYPLYEKALRRLDDFEKERS